MLTTFSVTAGNTSSAYRALAGTEIVVKGNGTATWSSTSGGTYARLGLDGGRALLNSTVYVKVTAVSDCTVTLEQDPRVSADTVALDYDDAGLTDEQATVQEAIKYLVSNGGDVTGPAASVDSEMVLFSGTTGKSIKRASATGIAVMTSGVVSTVTAPSGTVVGTSDTQTLTNKTISGASNTLTVRLANDVSGTLPVGNGGTGLTTGTSGGFLYFSAADTIASSGAMTQYGVLYGGGAGAAPSATAVGTAGQVLTSNGAGVAPSFQSGIAMTGLTAATEFDHDNLVLTYSIANTQAEKITYKELFNRVSTLADGTTITPNCEAARQFNHSNTQASGTLTVANPTGTPVDGQQMIMRIKSTNAQTYSFGTSYRGGTTALPTSHTGSSKTDYLGWIYNSADSKWDYVALSAGF